jgi:hypothetical protein
MPDSGPIISFARAGRPDLLKQVTTELRIPDAVFEELVASGDDRPGAKEVKQGFFTPYQPIMGQVFGETVLFCHFEPKGEIFLGSFAWKKS